MRSSDTCHFSFSRLTEENSWYSIAVKYSTVDDSFELRFNNIIALQGSCVSGNLENFELNRVLVQEQNWAGLRLYDSLLTDAEVASELDTICVPADTCADVLTAGCDTAPACPLAEPSGAAASPKNITFLVSTGNVSAAALAPHHTGILAAVSTALNTAASTLSIASVADAAHNAANLRLVAAEVPGADVDALSQKTDEVAAAVKDAVNSAAGGSAVVCAAKAATILGSGANLTVYC